MTACIKHYLYCTERNSPTQFMIGYFILYITYKTSDNSRFINTVFNNFDFICPVYKVGLHINQVRKMKNFLTCGKSFV